jgi:hypothetical protein
MHPRYWSKILCACAALFLLAPLATAQKVVNTGPKYDTANEVKLKGTVEDIREVPGDYEGIHLVVKTDKGDVLVHVAPASFLKDIDTSFKKGDEVQVVGSKAPQQGNEEEVLAREITVGTNTCTLRDDKGVPVWAGWKSGK